MYTLASRCGLYFLQAQDCMHSVCVYSRRRMHVVWPEMTAPTAADACVMEVV